jgi:chromosome segregation ATPase
MPLGLWKSKWEIHREAMDRRDAEWRSYCAKSDEQWAEWRAERAKADEQWAEWRAEHAKADEQWAEWRAERAKAQAERAETAAEWRERHDELMARMDENRREARAAFKIVVEELRAVRREVHDLTDAVNANTEAILKLIDRFDQWEGRPPGSGRMGPRSA